ncbi:MAG: hypothetical protein JO337_10365 [Acidimicrobiales bacterium]|nr:hypothetical protein [Acidimicrobiales bacterium]
MRNLAETMRMTWFILGDDDSEDAPAAMVLDMQPGHVIARHAHDCERVEIVVSGSLDVGDRILRAGDIMVAHPGEFYGPHVAGPEGCMTLEVFSAARETHQIVYQAEDGTKVKPDALIGEYRPRRLAGMEGVREKVAAVRAEAAKRNS